MSISNHQTPGDELCHKCKLLRMYLKHRYGSEHTLQKGEGIHGQNEETQNGSKASPDPPRHIHASVSHRGEGSRLTVPAQCQMEVIICRLWRDGHLPHRACMCLWPVTTIHSRYHRIIYRQEGLEGLHVKTKRLVQHARHPRQFTLANGNDFSTTEHDRYSQHHTIVYWISAELRWLRGMHAPPTLCSLVRTHFRRRL